MNLSDNDSGKSSPECVVETLSSCRYSLSSSHLIEYIHQELVDLPELILIGCSLGHPFLMGEMYFQLVLYLGLEFFMLIPDFPYITRINVALSWKFPTPAIFFGYL